MARWGDRIECGEHITSITSVVNNYKALPEVFSREEFVNLRILNGQPTNIRSILSRWRKEGKIVDIDKNHFRKTDLQA